MTVSMGIAVYFTMWWIVLFVTLPFGVRSQREEGSYFEGTDPGAPVSTNLRAKALWTTLISAILFAALLYYIKYLA
eukprot:gene7659-7720_t